ncbi:MAG: discoidin domain-containing protein [Acidobacteriota bacterium]
MRCWTLLLIAASWAQMSTAGEIANVTLGKPVTATGHYSDRIPQNAVDGDLDSRWENRTRNRVVRLEVDLLGTFLLESAEIETGFGSGNAPERLELQYFDGFCWLPIPGATVVDNPDDNRRVLLTFTEPVVADRIRLHSMDAQNNLIQELVVFGEPTSQSVTAETGGCSAGEHVAVLDPYYDHALHLPPDYNLDPETRWPLIVSLHGIGGNILNGDRSAVLSSPEGFAKQVENGTLADFPAIVASLHCRSVGQTSNCWFDPDRVIPMLESFKEDFLVDPNRVIFTGLSGGAIVSYRLGVLIPDQLAGLVPVAGMFPGGELDRICNLKRLHIWAFAGTNDSSFPPGRNDFVRDRLAQDCPPFGEDYMVSTAIEGGTHSGSTWDVAYAMPELHQWLLDVTKLDPVQPPLFSDDFETGTLHRWTQP